MFSSYQITQTSCEFSCCFGFLIIFIIKIYIVQPSESITVFFLYEKCVRHMYYPIQNTLKHMFFDSVVQPMTQDCKNRSQKTSLNFCESSFTQDLCGYSQRVFLVFSILNTFVFIFELIFF
jgi:hypothetical protein